MSLAPIFKIQGIDWVILQNDNLEKITSDLKVIDDLKQTSLTIVGDKLGDMLDTAAICTQLDLVVSVDTAVAHLAGALNIPVFLLLPTFCDWRWGIDQTISSWYPKTEIFRQHITGVWNVPVERVATRLSEELAKLEPKQHGQ